MCLEGFFNMSNFEISLDELNAELLWASENGNLEVVKFLKSKGAGLHS